MGERMGMISSKTEPNEIILRRIAHLEQRLKDTETQIRSSEERLNSPWLVDEDTTQLHSRIKYLKEQYGSLVREYCYSCLWLGLRWKYSGKRLDSSYAEGYSDHTSGEALKR